MDEQCIDCGHGFDIHHLKDGLCFCCRELQEWEDEDNNEQWEEIAKGQELYIGNVSKTK